MGHGDRIVVLLAIVITAKNSSFARDHEFSWRHQQNWIGEDLGERQQVDFVPARPEDLPTLLQGLLDTATKAREVIDSGNVQGWDETGQPLFDPVVYAAIIAFGFVFIHPFMDGNGRIHRYLIHEVLAKAGFASGIVLPMSCRCPTSAGCLLPAGRNILLPPPAWLTVTRPSHFPSTFPGWPPGNCIRSHAEAVTARCNRLGEKSEYRVIYFIDEYLWNHRTRLGKAELPYPVQLPARYSNTRTDQGPIF
ncbi:Fic family protein [Pseudohalioglobus lutimaris]|uniref:Fic family protein n=1 Tax=Pseudohalioglobus lutimaris TaxID=1737061 RepID=UPI001FAF6CF3|nr:Fic family protein [Pseudohalioglobus lutimaris]